MRYTERLYNSAYGTIVTLLGPLADSIDLALERMGLEGASLALVRPGQLETHVTAYVSNGNGHHQETLQAPNPAASKWGKGFYPMVDARKPGSHNRYNPKGINSKVAREIYNARSAKKPEPTVSIKKVKRDYVTSHQLRISRHSKLFKSN